MITPTQMRAARAMLDVSQGHVADHLGIAANTLSKIESGQSDISVTRNDEIRKFYEREGIEFSENDGVRWSREEITIYEGHDQFFDFVDDVYNTVKKTGGELCLFNSKPKNWINILGQERYNMHAKRMGDLGDKITVKITSKKGDTNFIAKSFAEHRWVSEELFNDVIFYVYGDNIAFMTFEEDNSRVLVLKHEEFARGFRILFNIAWDSVAEVPKIPHGSIES